MDRRMAGLVACLLAIVAIDAIGSDHVLQGAGIGLVAMASLMEAARESKAGPVRIAKYVLAGVGLILYLAARYGPAA